MPSTVLFPQPVVDPDAIDPLTGIRNGDLRLMLPAQLQKANTALRKSGSTKAKTADTRMRPPGVPVDPEDRLFPKPVLQIEPHQKRQSRGTVLKLAFTESDYLKLANFHLTWDCMNCPRTFLDKVLIGQQERCCMVWRGWVLFVQGTWFPCCNLLPDPIP